MGNGAHEPDIADTARRPEQHTPPSAEAPRSLDEPIPSGVETDDPGDEPAVPRDPGDGRPLDVAPETGPVDLGTPEAGMPP